MQPGRFGLTFHHFGLGVAAPAAAFAFLAGLGYTAGAAVFDPLQKVNLAMRHHAAMPDVEVIWPGDGPSPLDRLLRKNGSMVYHLCYEAADPERAAQAIEDAGLNIVAISLAQPALLFGGREVSFYSVGDVGLIELLRTAQPIAPSA